ncbi:hypothetical protein [Pengzhenrongella sp.]|uniref:hypothetical protein n=1 Tax=Pengzhenrongella sp. TaxID=2888820 RepID=UPI002F91E255
MDEHMIVVVFDVTAPNREVAARMIHDAIGFGDGLFPDIQERSIRAGGGCIKSWWFAEGDVKHVDENENDDMVLSRADA